MFQDYEHSREHLQDDDRMCCTCCLLCTKMERKPARQLHCHLCRSQTSYTSLGDCLCRQSAGPPHIYGHCSTAPETSQTQSPLQSFHLFILRIPANQQSGTNSTFTILLFGLTRFAQISWQIRKLSPVMSRVERFLWLARLQVHQFPSHR